jgi:hypothetical protein
MVPLSGPIGPFTAVWSAGFVPPQAEGRTIALEWDPSPDSTVAGYYVMAGSSTGQYTERLDAGRLTSFRYDAADPGRPYYFAVVAYTADGLISEPSNEVVVPAGSTAPDPRRPRRITSAEVSPGNAGDRPSEFCFVSHETECYEARVKARGSGHVSHLAPTLDGRLFFVHDGRSIRVLERDGLLSVPALSVDFGQFRIAGLAVDPDYLRTRHVYVAKIAGGSGEVGELSVVRYREIGNVLGERASIVPSIPVPAAAHPRLTLDDAGRLYVAIPSTQRAGVRPSSPYEGMLLRFNIDGTTPRDNQAGSPVFARGFDVPTGLEWDQVDRVLRLSGWHPEWSHSVAYLQPDQARAVGWAPPAFPDPAIGNLAGQPFALAALAPAGPWGPALLLVDAEHRFVRVRLRRPAATAPSDVSRLAGAPAVTGAAVGPDGTLFVATRVERFPPGNPDFQILSLR